jgi:chromosome segregation ATPase
MSAPGVIPWLAVLIALLASGGLGWWLAARRGRAAQQIADLFEQQLASAQRSLDERDSRLATQAQELRTLRHESDGAQRRLAAAGVDVTAARQRAGELESLTLQLRDRDSQLQRLNADLDAIHDYYSAEIGELRRKLGDNDALRTQLARTEQQLRALDARLALVQRDKDLAIATLSTRLAELESQASASVPRAVEPEHRSIEPAQLSIDAESATPRDQRVRELEHDTARLRQRIMQLDALHAVVQQRDQDIERLKNQIEELRK